MLTAGRESHGRSLFACNSMSCNPNRWYVNDNNNNKFHIYLAKKMTSLILRSTKVFCRWCFGFVLAAYSVKQRERRYLHVLNNGQYGFYYYHNRTSYRE